MPDHLIHRPVRLLARVDHDQRAHDHAWDMINPFSQEGVELGTVPVKRIVSEFESPSEPALERGGSASGLIRRYRTTPARDGRRSR